MQTMSTLGRAPRGGLKSDLFCTILLYFRPSGILPIDSSRREDQNPPGEMKIGDFCDFGCFLGSLTLLEASLMVPDSPRMIPEGFQNNGKIIPE